MVACIDKREKKLKCGYTGDVGCSFEAKHEVQAQMYHLQKKKIIQ